MKPNNIVIEKFTGLVDRSVAPMRCAPSIAAALSATALLRHLDKGAHLLEPGQAVEHLYYIDAGLLRYYYLYDQTGEERTGQFFESDSVYTDVKSFVTQAPAQQYIQALEPSIVLCIPRQTIYALYEHEHALERFGRLMVERALIGSQQRTLDFMSQSVEQRYLEFITRRPELAKRIPQYMLAGYLGITPEALSRIRRRAMTK